jgi:protein TonB
MVRSSQGKILSISVLSLMFLIVTFAQSPQTSISQSANDPNAAREKTATSGKNAVSMPVCSYMPSPLYTKEAKAAKFEGTVKAMGIVTVDGHITNIRIVQSPGLGLDESVLNALKDWKCKPAIGPKGEPVPVVVPFEINFRRRKGN